MSMLNKITVFIATMVLLTAFCGCSLKPEQVHTPPEAVIVDEIYSYTTKSAYYLYPSLVDNWAWRNALKTETDDGTFFCFTDDRIAADGAINSERTLLGFLGECGIPTDGITTYVTDYDFSFSESEKSEIYVSLSHLNSWRQVLVTLQALCGDYTDYGYVYAMSNAISAHLGWETDDAADLDEAEMNGFFVENPEALSLVYPAFSAEYSTEETVNYCKQLSIGLFNEIEWYTSLQKPVSEQLDAFHLLIDQYANEINAAYTRENIGYAYYSEMVPLRIRLKYATMLVDYDFDTLYEEQYGHDMGEEYKDELIHFFSDYKHIYKTAAIFDSEITEAVERFGLEETADGVVFEWMNRDSAFALYDKTLANMYYSNTKRVSLTIMTSYLHEYYHHLEHLLNPDLGMCWQSQAFCEIGRSHSYHSLKIIEDMMKNTPELAEKFIEYTGRAYEGGILDYYEAYDILTYIYDGFDPTDYYNGRNPMNSFNRYLIDLYGEDAVCGIMLFPDTVTDTTGKTWEELQTEWEMHISDKYAGKGIPGWLD